METTADVLIIGAGASGAALAWSLAETRMNIVCLEQGEWIDPAQLPGTSTDWEVRQLGDFNFSPNTRQRREDYPVNDSESPIAVSMFNAVGGSTILYAAHFPRFRPTDFRVRSLDGVADDWPIDYARLEPYYDAEGIERRQKAEVVVVACNGIGTPRLLLNSRSKQFPDGLANRSGLVGRNLMFHPYAMVTGLFDEPLEGYKGPTGCCIMSQEFYASDPSRGFTRGYSFEILRGFGPVYTALWAMSKGQLPWGAGHHQTFAELFDRTAGMVVISEDLPDPANCVTLDPDMKDSDGIPSPKINYRLSENSITMLEHSVARATEVLEASGAKRTITESPLRVAGWHLMGTARMGTDPETSVANAWGRCHDVRNLFIVDGSIFVTAAAVNPTNTIQALALYIADTMKKNLANLFDD